MENLMEKTQNIVPNNVVTKTLAKYCNIYFRVYETSLNFRNCYTQSMFTVVPLNTDGSNMAIAFYFRNITRAILFMGCYNSHHALSFWQKRVSTINTRQAVLSMLWSNKIEIRHEDTARHQ